MGQLTPFRPDIGRDEAGTEEGGSATGVKCRGWPGCPQVSGCLEVSASAG